MNTCTRWWIGGLAVALAACRAGNGTVEQAGNGDVGLDPPVNSVSVSGYCEEFAGAYSEINGFGYRPGSASTDRSSDVPMWLQNAVQPPDSRFTAGYVCRFQAMDEAEARRFKVRIYLTKTRGFAEHTQWERLQLVPIRHVLDETDSREGFGVFKYLRDH